MLLRSPVLATAGTILLLALARGARAQDTPGQHAIVRGRVIDPVGVQGIGSASITLRRAADTTFAGGAFTDARGSFTIMGLTPGVYVLRVRAMGFTPVVRSGVAVAAPGQVVDVGTIAVSPVAARLSGVTVAAEAPDATLALDRNSYSTRNMTTASGGTAADVLRNVPGVDVDATGRLSLRGNANVVVQLDGRSSPLHGDQLAAFLAQLPANTIARVEVATNPSARDDPEGTAGTINLVLKQQVEMQRSGNASVGMSSAGLRTAAGSLGEQRGPWTLFGSYSYFGDERVVTGYRNLTNASQSGPTLTASRTHATNRPSSQTATFRSEYRLDKHTAFAFDALVLDGDYERESLSRYRRYDATPAEIGRYDRVNDQRLPNTLQDYALAFRRSGASAANTLATELRLTQGTNRVASTLFGRVEPPYPSAEAGSAPEYNVGRSRFPSWSLQSDLTRGLDAHVRVEAGVKGTLRRTRNDFAAAALDTVTGQTTPEPARATRFDYREQIGAGYVLLSRRGSRLQTQAGMRVEQTVGRFTGDTLPSHDARYASAFPSAAVAWTPTAKRQLRLSYARRITRPDGSQRNPAVFREDATHAFVGNPNLTPEYTDALELTVQEGRGWGTLQVAPYLRRTAHALRFVERLDTTEVAIGTYDNVGRADNLGVDLNTTFRHGPLTLVTGANVYEYRSEAANLPGDLSVRTTSWSARANTSLKLSARTDVQVSGSYRAAVKVEGGSEAPVSQLNVALRRKLWGDQGSVTLRVTDPFETTQFGFRTVNGGVYEDSRRGFGRIVAISVSRNFGKQLRLRAQDDPDVQGPPPTLH